MDVSRIRSSDDTIIHLQPHLEEPAQDLQAEEASEGCFSDHTFRTITTGAACGCAIGFITILVLNSFKKEIIEFAISASIPNLKATLTIGLAALSLLGGAAGALIYHRNARK